MWTVHNGQPLHIAVAGRTRNFSEHCLVSRDFCRRHGKFDSTHTLCSEKTPTRIFFHISMNYVWI